MNYCKTGMVRSPEVPCDCRGRVFIDKRGLAICKKCKRLWKLVMKWKLVGKIGNPP